MATREQIGKFTDAERDAWMSSLSEDENVILRAPPGYKYRPNKAESVSMASPSV